MTAPQPLQCCERVCGQYSALTKKLDKEVVENFMSCNGIKIVCGGSTGAMVANVLDRRMDIRQEDKSLIAPPRCSIDGIDLVTEGAVTLNQAYNILDADARSYSEVSSVTELCCLLQVADKVDITMGLAKNPSGDDIAFASRDNLPTQIITLNADKLANGYRRRQKRFDNRLGRQPAPPDPWGHYACPPRMPCMPPSLIYKSNLTDLQSAAPVTGYIMYATKSPFLVAHVQL